MVHGREGCVYLTYYHYYMYKRTQGLSENGMREGGLFVARAAAQPRSSFFWGVITPFGMRDCYPFERGGGGGSACGSLQTGFALAWARLGLGKTS